MHSGLKPLSYDRRDYDLLKTFGATAPAQFPDAYSVENGLWTPNQSDGGDPIFGLPPMPYGCTNYTQADCCADDDQHLHNPMLMENVTHANARGGVEMREALNAAKKVYGRTAYFRITATHPLDMFDAIRLGLLSTKEEGRSASVGTPWFFEWTAPKNGILPIPASFSVQNVAWHNWKIAGWKTINGVPYLIGKPWCGKNYGDKGFIYMSRELCNAVFGIPGSCAFTMTKLTGIEPQRVDLEVVQWIVSLIRRVFKFDQEPAPVPPPPPAPLPPKPESLADSLADRLADAATAALDTEPTPLDQVQDAVACVASLVAVTRPVLQLDPTLAYTPHLLDALKADKRFVSTKIPKRGCIIVSPTVGQVRGHCGIFLDANTIASNDSRSGLWKDNYTFKKWADYFKHKKGLRIFVFEPVDIA